MKLKLFVGKLSGPPEEGTGGSRYAWIWWHRKVTAIAIGDKFGCTAASVVPAYMGSKPGTTVQGVPCPTFSAGTTPPAVATTPTVPTISVRTMKDLVKIPEFSGRKGYGSPDDAETWMRQVARAIRVHRWSIEDTFEIVQARLTGTAATWYQNRENILIGI